MTTVRGPCGSLRTHAFKEGKSDPGLPSKALVGHDGPMIFRGKNLITFEGLHGASGALT